MASGSHAMALFSSAREFVEAAAPFVEEGLDVGQAVWVFAGPEQAEALRRALGGAARVRLVDSYGWRVGRPQVFADLADAIAGWDRQEALRVRILGQPHVDRCSDDVLTELSGLEVAMSTLAPVTGVDVLCTYDRRALSPQALGDALATHRPEIDVRSFVRDDLWRRPLPPPDGPVVDVVQTRSHPAGARWLIVELARGAGLDGSRAQDLGLAVHEVVTNAVRYAHPPRVRFWTEHDRVVWEVRDRGPGIGDPLAGYRLPDPVHRFGRGLWLARRLVDLLQIRSSPAGTTVRLHVMR